MFPVGASEAHVQINMIPLPISAPLSAEVTIQYLLLLKETKRTTRSRQDSNLRSQRESDF